MEQFGLRSLDILHRIMLLITCDSLLAAGNKQYRFDEISKRS